MKKYSDYIRYPIRMEVEKSRPEGGRTRRSPEYETYTEVETLNSMVPLWQQKQKRADRRGLQQLSTKRNSLISRTLRRVIHTSTEGAATYNALLFIPARAPYNYYTRDYEKGLQLYASGVLIMDKCADLLPDLLQLCQGPGGFARISP